MCKLKTDVGVGTVHVGPRADPIAVVDGCYSNVTVRDLASCG